MSPNPRPSLGRKAGNRNEDRAHRPLLHRGALVVGAGSPLAVAIARAMARAGACVVVSDLHRSKAAEAAALLGRRCPGYTTLDVTRPRSCEAAVAWAAKRVDLSIVVNCASFSSRQYLEGKHYTEWKRSLDVSLGGALNVLAASQGMERPGAILTISSVNAQLPVPGYAAYCASKAGLGMLTRVAALELAPGIRVNAIAPGPLEPTWGWMRDFPGFLSGLRRRHPLGNRLTRPADVAPLAVFLCSEEASWMTGQTVTVDGGVSLNYGDLPSVAESV